MPEEGRSGRLARNPALLLFTSACTIIAVPLAIYLYFAGQRHRHLVYTVAEARTLVVDPTYSSSLRLIVNGVPVTSQVTGVQVQVKNDGDESIKPENVLKPIQIITVPATRIFEARPIAISRDIVNLKIDQSKLSEGVIPLSWRILEKNDGATLQVIYAGSPQVGIRLAGLVEGQRAIATASEGVGGARAMKAVAGILTGAILPAFTAVLAFLFFRRLPDEPREAGSGHQYAEVIFVPRRTAKFRKLKISHRLLFSTLVILVSSMLLSIFFFLEYLRSTGAGLP